MSFNHITYLKMAKLLASNAHCHRAKVGAIITDEKGVIIGSGRNGAGSGLPPCHLKKGSTDECMGTHAEMNALLNCSDIKAAYRLYVTMSPCKYCTVTLGNTNIQEIYYIDEYRETKHLDWWTDIAGRKAIQLKI